MKDTLKNINNEKLYVGEDNAGYFLVVAKEEENVVHLIPDGDTFNVDVNNINFIYQFMNRFIANNYDIPNSIHVDLECFEDMCLDYDTKTGNWKESFKLHPTIKWIGMLKNK